MKRIITSALVLFFSFCLTEFVFSEEKATKEECVAKCKEAAQMVKNIGIEAALKKMQDKNGPFVWKDTYIFCIDIEKGWAVAHPIKPGLVHKKLVGIRDIDGKMFFAELIKVAKTKGEGWVSYKWPKVGEKKPLPKLTFVYRVPGENMAICAGIYP
ncbi:cache domain-containing protein [Desulfobacterales bacterium HSG2]|nr:cache domain-containing protein [Desulfobacterales bacterium HSG2]